MSELNPLFRAHMLLYRWGCEAEARQAAEGDGPAAGAPSAAGDGSEEPAGDSIFRPTIRSSRSVNGGELLGLDSLIDWTIMRIGVR